MHRTETSSCQCWWTARVVRRDDTSCLYFVNYLVLRPLYEYFEPYQWMQCRQGRGRRLIISISAINYFYIKKNSWPISSAFVTYKGAKEGCWGVAEVQRTQCKEHKLQKGPRKRRRKERGEKTSRGTCIDKLHDEGGREEYSSWLLT